MSIILPALDQYCRERSKPVSSVLQELEKYTRDNVQAPSMLSGPIEGGFLRLLIQILQAKRVLEIGMYTGYSALTMALALPDDGEVHTCELATNHIEVARRFFGRSKAGEKIVIHEGEAKESLAKLKGPFDLAFVDADKTSYPFYFEECLRLVRIGGVLCFDNALWSGTVLRPIDDDARAIDELNQLLAKSDRVENVLLPIRDGIHVARIVC